MRTKLIAVLTFISAITAVSIDLLNGGGFDIKTHAKEIYIASGSAGLYFLRDAIQKLMAAVTLISGQKVE